MPEAARIFSGLTGINNYVPAMAYSAGMVHGQPTAYSLGTPALFDADGIDVDIDGDAVAGTETVQDYTADSPFGRNILMQANADPGNAAVYDVYGRDYLGQPMVERFTHSNGSTPIVYGKKCFYTVTKVVVVTPATNAVTIDLGFGSRLGLPYKGDLAWAKEGGVLVPLYKRPFDLVTNWSDADTTSGGSMYVRAPCPGYISQLWGLMGSGGSTTNAATTVELATIAITGLTITLDQDVPGNYATDTPTTAGYNANNRFIANDAIEIVHAATTAGGIMTVGVTVTPVQQVLPDLTDAATVSSGDTRGSYESIAVLDGLTEIVVGLVGDPSVNSGGNGGLHGIQHYFA